MCVVHDLCGVTMETYLIFVCLFAKVVKFLGFISCRTMFFESNVSAVDFLLKTARCEGPTQPPQQQRSTASASVAALRSGDTPSPSVHSALFRQLRGHHHHLGPEMVPSEVRSRGGSGPLDNLLGGGDTGTQQSILCLVLRCGLEAGLPISLAQ